MASELELKYGCNPNQKPSRIYMKDGSELPVKVLSGKPGYINFLDALNSWQLVRELKEATGLPAAASFKHVSPAGAAVGLPLSDIDRQIYFVDDEGPLTPIACAYIRARGADRMSSYGDWAALSDVCDERTALYIKHEVSDGIIAPGYTPEALAILSAKKGGKYNVVQIDPDYVCPATETKDVFGITFEQGHNFFRIDRDLLADVVTANKDIPEHMATLEEKEIKPFDLVCVNLYDFAGAVERKLSLEQAVEEIDIGGPCMIRAAAKNFHSILVLPGTKWYATAMQEMKEHDMKVSLDFRQAMASRAFEATSRYDALITSYLRPGA